MFDATHSTHFLSASSTSWTSVNQIWKWRSVTGALFGAFSVQHQNTSVMRSCIDNVFFCNLIVVCSNRRHERSFPHLRQFDGFIEVFIWHNRTDGSKSLCFVNCQIIKRIDRKSTRLNSSHVRISYAVFCLKKKKNRKFVRRLRQSRTLQFISQRHSALTHIATRCPPDNYP